MLLLITLLRYIVSTTCSTKKTADKDNRIRKLKYPIPVAASFIYGGFVATIGYWLNHPDSINQNQLLDIINDIKNNIDSLEFLFEA